MVITGAREPIRPRSRCVGLVTLVVVLQAVRDATPAQEAAGERPARGGDQPMRFVLGGSKERAACGTRGKPRREERHGVRLRRWAGHASGHRRGGKAMRPR